MMRLKGDPTGVRKWRSRVLSVGVLNLAWLSITIGCTGGKSKWDATHPASGEVVFKGNPVKDAELAFFPVDTTAPETVRPRAKSTDGGKFVVWTFQSGDGIPEGDYKVTVVRNEVAVSKDTIVAKPNDLPPKYSKLDSTDIIVKIAAGKNEDLKIELK